MLQLRGGLRLQTKRRGECPWTQLRNAKKIRLKLNKSWKKGLLSLLHNMGRLVDMKIFPFNGGSTIISLK